MLEVGGMLEDGSDDNNGMLSVNLHHDGQRLFVSIAGYGDSCSDDGSGMPVMFELYKGELRLVVWADINKQAPTHVINMEGALESTREKE